MVLDTCLEVLLSFIGHDGSEIVWPEQKGSFKYKAFHIEEIQYAALELGTCFAPFVQQFSYAPGRETTPCLEYLLPLQGVMRFHNGIIVGRYRGRFNHAVAWDAREQTIYDPSGIKVRGTDAFEIDAFYAAIRL